MMRHGAKSFASSAVVCPGAGSLAAILESCGGVCRSMTETRLFGRFSPRQPWCQDGSIVSARAPRTQAASLEAGAGCRRRPERRLSGARLAPTSSASSRPAAAASPPAVTATGSGLRHRAQGGSRVHTKVRALARVQVRVRVIPRSVGVQDKDRRKC